MENSPNLTVIPNEKEEFCKLSHQKKKENRRKDLEDEFVLYKIGHVPSRFKRNITNQIGNVILVIISIFKIGLDVINAG